MQDRRTHGQRLVAIVGSLLGLLMLVNMAWADADSAAFRDLSATWWQWALSIPASHNPLLDTTGNDCMVGQRGGRWFLAGFLSGGSATRTCTIPEGTRLFFPVVNQAFVDTPNQCGQGADSVPLKEMRATVAAIIDGFTTREATLDGKPIKDIKRVRSTVFEVALPEDNIFVAFGITPCDAGIYSPTVDDGYYVQLNPLDVGDHTLVLHAENQSAGFTLLVTYTLLVVPVAK